MATHKVAQAKKKAFLDAFRKIGIIAAACQASDVPRRTHYSWLENDPDYKAQYADALDDACDALEAEAMRRGTGKGASDTILIVLLKMRGRFVERREHTGAGGGPVQHTALTDEDRERAQQIADRRLTPPDQQAETA